MIRQLFVDGIVYLIPTVLSRGIGLLLLPIYTRYLSPTEFGVIEILGIFYAVLNLTLPLEVSQAVARMFADADTEIKKCGYASSGFWLTIGTFFLFYIIVLILPEHISLLILDDKNYANIMQIASLAMLVNAVFYYMQNHLRWSLQSKAMAFTSICFAIVMAGVTVISLVVLKLGLIGVLLGQLAGSFIGVLLSLIFANQKVKIKIFVDLAKLKEMLTYSTPLVVSSLAIYFNQFSDRWILRAWTTMEDVAIYSVSYRIAAIIGFVVYIFQLAYTPIFYNHYKEINTPRKVDEIYRIYLLLTLSTLVLLYSFSGEIIALLAGENYKKAGDPLIFITLSIILAGSSIFFPGLRIAKKTMTILKINIIAALINIIVSTALVEKYGINGVAIGTLIGVFIMLILYKKYSNQEYKVPYAITRYMVSFLILLIALLFIYQIKLTWTYKIIMWLLVSMFLSVTLIDKNSFKIIISKLAYRNIV